MTRANDGGRGMDDSRIIGKEAEAEDGRLKSRMERIREAQAGL